MTKKKKENAPEVTGALKEKVTAFFTENPKAKQVYTTPDDFLFTNLKFANDHAKTLGEEPAKCHKNPNYIEVETEEDTEE